MCGRFVVLTREEIESVVAAVESRSAGTLPHIGSSAGQETTIARSQAFPGSTIELISPSSGAGNLHIANAIWGFEADWSKRPVFNTRIESALADSAFWKEAVQEGRCVIPAAAFFEPHESETIRSPRTGRQVKRPYQFSAADGMPLLLAGVQANGRCSIVTSEPNRWVAPIHPRMPLVLRFEEVTTWLGPEWPSLADRSAIELHVAPEQLGEQADNPTQLSLF